MREKQLKLGLQNSRFYGPQRPSPPPPTEWSGSPKCASHSLFLLLPLSSTLPPRVPFNKSKMREGTDEKSHKETGGAGAGGGWERQMKNVWERVNFTLTLALTAALASRDMNVNRESRKYCQWSNCNLSWDKIRNIEDVTFGKLWKDVSFPNTTEICGRDVPKPQPNFLFFFANSRYWNFKIYGT